MPTVFFVFFVCIFSLSLGGAALAGARLEHGRLRGCVFLETAETVMTASDYYTCDYWRRGGSRLCVVYTGALRTGSDSALQSSRDVLYCIVCYLLYSAGGKMQRCTHSLCLLDALPPFVGS